MSHPWTMVIAVARPNGAAWKPARRGGMSVAGTRRGEQREKSLPGILRRLPARPESRRLPLAAAVLSILLAGLAIVLAPRRHTRTASLLSRFAPATYPDAPQDSAGAAPEAEPAATDGAPVSAVVSAVHNVADGAEVEPARADSSPVTVAIAAGASDSAPAEPRHIEAAGTVDRERSRKRPAQRAALAAGLLALCAVAAVMVSGIAPQSFTIASASSAEGIIPPIATIVEAPPGPDCDVLKCVTLTFDDGPDRYSTPALLDILESRGVPANFFVLGSLIEGNEDIILRMQRLGMGVENHTWNHPNLAAMSPAGVTDQLARTNGELSRVLGYMPKYMRPPYGAWTPGYTPTHGMHPVMWEVDPQDWLYRNSATVTQNVVNLVGPGDVILLHDIHQTSVDAVPMIIDALHASGYTFVTLDDLYATRPDCHVNQYCTAPVPYASTPSATTTVAPQPTPGYVAAQGRP